MFKLKFLMFVLALTITGGVMILTHKQECKYSDLILEDIEALSNCRCV